MSHGVMFHHFFNAEHAPAQGAMSAEDLVDLVNFIGRDRVLPAEQWMERALKDQLDDRDVCLTFDDALLCQYDIAVPVLQDMGLTAFWFVYSSVFEGRPEKLEIYRYFRNNMYGSVDEFYVDFFEETSIEHGERFEQAKAAFDPDSYLAQYPIYSYNDRLFRFIRDEILGPEGYNGIMTKVMERQDFDVADASSRLWMRDEHLRNLDKAGHVIGLHSYTHPTRLERLDREAQAEEYAKNKDHLSRVLSHDPVVMSHPCNSYNDDTLDLLANMGVKLGFRANMARLDAPSALEFPREDHANLMREMHK